MKKEKRPLLILIFLALLGSLLTAGAETPGYAAYLAGFSEAAYPQETLQADLGNAGIPLRDDPLHQRGAVLTLERPGDEVSLLVMAPQAGLYQLAIDYLALPARAGSIEISILINGEIPFLQSKGILLRRLFHTPGPITRDSRGHDVRPEMVEQMAWQSVRVQDHNNHFAQPFYYYLSQGENRVDIRLLAESVALAGLRFLPTQAPPAYSEYASRYPAAGSAGSILIQAEEAGLRSSEVIYALAARGDAALHPSDPVKTRLNTIGGYAWRQQGEWVEWTFDAPEDGWYALSMHLLNDFVRGMPSTRRLWVDGSVPFMEAQAVSIPYAIAWQDFRLEGADGRSLPLYLSRGPHSLRLEVAPGENAGTLRRLEEAIARMNLLYRRIIVITGDNADGSRVSIDLNRDFHLETKIPGLLEDLASLSATLRQEYAAMSAYAGRGSEAALLNQAAIQLDSFIDRPDLIPARLESYKGNLSSLSSWVLYMREQPLQIDSIALTGTAGTPPANGVTIFDRIGFRWQGFVGSFLEDYSAVGEVYSGRAVRPLQVWVCANDLGATGISSGRDQTQVIKELIDQYFVPKSGIPVNLSLIDGSSTLMQATLGGKGPDVALTVYKELPVNLAMRGALLDLSQFKGFRELLPAFHESALLPYRYKGGVYALPETQNFDMIFYRADIFEEMGLQVPQTWEDLRALVPVLQKQGMQIGIAAPTVTNNNTAGFQAQLFQRGLNYYTADQTRTTFDEAGALDAFKAWTELYTKYSLPIQYDMFSRFRTGEMPLAIASYVTANTMAAGAPELTGLWGLAPIPGTRRSDGSIDRSQGATGTGVILLANTSLPDQAFTFASWWTSSQTQAQFALALESLMGSAARWPTANREAFLHIKWTQQQQEALLTQWEDVDDIPQLPGNYITNRNLTFAFRAVVYNNKTPREVLNRYNKEINKEIQRKWEEFGQ